MCVCVYVCVRPVGMEPLDHPSAVAEVPARAPRGINEFNILEYSSNVEIHLL